MNHEVLNKYLAQHKSISIPGLGALVAENVPAITDFVNRQIHPVQRKLRFDKYFDAPDRDFYNYLAHQQNIPDFEAIRWYNEFAYQLRNQIRTDGSATWKGIGLFTRESNGEISFEQFRSAYELFPTIAAERVVRTSVNHSILVGDKEKTTEEMTEYFNEDKKAPAALPVSEITWKKFAWVLAALAALVLIFHFSRNGIKWGISGNRKSVSAFFYQSTFSAYSTPLIRLNK